MARAIREHLRDFVAILALVALALATTGVILVQQRASLPSWVPILGTDRFELRADFTSAQAITPGQGQTVTIAGINVGDVTGVELQGGEAVVTMEIDNKYAPLIHRNATLLLRPRTGLNDMTIELDPGTGTSTVPEGWTVPLAQTQPNVQPDQILASLDADTRSFLQLLLSGGAKGIGNGRELSSVLRRLDPTVRDLARINGALAKRRRNLALVIHDFGLLSKELAAHDRELAGFVSSSDAVFRSFAREARSLRAAISRAPGALSATRGALASSGRLAEVLGPSSRALIPSAQALGPALRDTRPLFGRTTGPIRDQIRPFTRIVRRPVNHVAAAAKPLDATATALAAALTSLNQLFNILAYDPPGGQQSFLFFLGWLNHDTNAAFNLQDASGPLARGLVLQSCNTASLSEILASAPNRTFLKTLQQLTNVPTQATIDANGGCG